MNTWTGMVFRFDGNVAARNVRRQSFAQLQVDQLKAL